MSTISWPFLTSSPSATCHFATMPSCMARPHFGITIIWMSSLICRRAPPPRSWRCSDVEILERRRERHRRVRRGDHLDRRLQCVEGVLGDKSGDVGRHVAARVRLVDDHQPAGLLDRLEDGVAVERRGGARIDHGAGDAGLLEVVGRLVGEVHHAAERDDGDVVALAGDVGLAERDCVGLVRHLALGRRTSPCARRRSPGRRRGSPGSGGPWPRRGSTAAPPSARGCG
jgi:hypothetical protein